MLYAIKIGFEEFDVNKLSEIKRMFSYCEKTFGFNGKKWEEIKNNFDYEELGELLECIGVDYQEFIE